MTPEVSRLRHIDALRALAALLVVWLHGTELFVQVSPQIGSRWIADAAKSVDIGRIGVVIFFGISGFLIPSSLRGSGWASIQDFALKRFFRLFPLFWFSIPLAVLLMWMPFGHEMNHVDFILNFTMIPEWLGAKPAIALYWTLQVELLFYVICAFLQFAGVLKHPTTLASTILVCLFGAFGLNFILRRIGFSPLDAVLWLNLAVMFIGALWRAQSEKPLQFFPQFILFSSITFVIFLLPLISLTMYVLGRWPTPDAFWPYAIGLTIFIILSRAKIIES
ncbi:MAG: acyltransferase family protein, partial [Beijerinckiaceae bacterium]